MAVPVVICGGSGSRLWPRSRRVFPKPFLALPGGGTLLGMTYDRARAVAGDDGEVVTVTAADHARLCAGEAAEHLGGCRHTILAEPHARNTAAAVAVAAAVLSRRGGAETVMAVLPADHLIPDTSLFRDRIAQAEAAAADGRIALLGIPPDRPAESYGYIERGEPLGGGAFQVARFVEKPDAERASALVSDGRHSWNAGIFVGRADVLLRELRTFAPEVAELAAALAEGADDDNGIVAFPGERYLGFPAVSFDRAVMEKTAAAAVVPAEGLAWSDVGSWETFAGQVEPDADGNRIEGRVVAVDSRNCTVLGERRTVAVVGVEGVQVVDTEDALLVAGAGSGERVREVYERLAKSGDPAAEAPAFVRRPWGGYQVISRADGYQVKRIDVEPGRRLSLQSHQQRSEHWTTVRGTPTVTIDDRVFDMPVDESCHIPTGARHRLANGGDAIASIVEVQVGAYLGEDDIVRYEDDFGRV